MKESYSPDIEKTRRLKAASTLKWFHWAIILASLFATLFAWSVTRKTSDNQIQAQFDREANQVVDLITERLTRYEVALWGGVAALSALEGDPSAQVWTRFSQTLNIEDKYPGINGIGIIDYVPRNKLETYVEQQRTGRSDFEVFPKHTHESLWPITYIEPVETNRAAVGLDIAHEKNRLEAAKKARDLGVAQITAPITLVQDALQTPGFLFYAPHYSVSQASSQTARRETFLNLVYAPFVFERLMDGTLETDRRLVHLRITDGEDILFDELTDGQAGRALNPAFRFQKHVEVYGRQWTFNILPNQAFEAATKNRKPWVILALGLAIEVLIIGLFLALAGANRRALSYADEMTYAYEAKANLLDNVMNNANDGIVLTDVSGGIQEINKSCKELFGYEEAEVLGKKFDVLFPYLKEDFQTLHGVDVVTATPDALKQFYIGEAREVTGRHKNGNLLALEVSISEIVENGQVLYNTIIRDISTRKIAEAKLKRTVQELVASNEDLERFAYVASHDLKSPLRAIDNLSKWLAEDLEPVIDTESKTRLKMLRGRVSRMDGLLNSLLSYSRISRQVAQEATITAAELLEEVIQTQNIPEGFIVDLRPSLQEIMISRMPLEQVFHNLLSNSIKHHDKLSGHIVIDGSDNDGMLTFSFTDDGPGIDVEFHKKIFEMFQTLRSRDDVEGSGMGLALVKKMLRRHNGNIEIKSSLGNGSTFIVTWPKSAMK